MSTSLKIIERLYEYRWYVVAVVTAWYLHWSWRSYRRLSHIKGPWLAHLSDFWLLKALYGQQTHHLLYAVDKTYGSLVRIGPNALITSDIDLVNRMNSARSPYIRSDWYLAFRLAPGVDNVGSMRDEKAHAKRRAQINLAYTGKENINTEPQIDSHVVNFIDLIKNKYISTEKESKIMDLAQKTQFFTIDVITDLAMGAPFGDLSSDSDRHEFLRTTMELQPAAIVVASMPWVSKILQTQFVGKLLFPTAQDEIGMGRMIGTAQKQVAERYNPSNHFEKPDILQSLFNHGLSEVETHAESLLLMFAGSDTTASAMRATMFALLTSPSTYRRLQAEIDSATLSSPVVRDEEARQLPYLQAVILEGLRVHPPPGGLLPKETPAEGDTINGTYIPGGVSIGTNIWAIMRNATVFGDDVECFRPERWLGIDQAKYAEMYRVVDLAFGSGRFKCLGRAIALMELNKVLVELLRNFDWSIVDPTNPWERAYMGVIVHRKLYVRVTERIEWKS